MVELKTRNAGHGVFSLTFWSYKDQVWKPAFGSKDPSAVARFHMEYWPKFMTFVVEKLKKVDKIEEVQATETEKFIKFFCMLDNQPLRITFKKRNLLKISFITPIEDISQVKNLCQRIILDVDFVLDNKSKV